MANMTTKAGVNDMNANDIRSQYMRLPTEELMAIAIDSAADLRELNSTQREEMVALSVMVDIALLVLSDRLPMSTFASICEDCDINLESH